MSRFLGLELHGYLDHLTLILALLSSSRRAAGPGGRIGRLERDGDGGRHLVVVRVALDVEGQATTSLRLKKT